MTVRITYEGKEYRRVGEDVQRRQWREGLGEYWMTLAPGPLRDFISRKLDEEEARDDIWKGIRLSTPTEKYKKDTFR